MTSITFTEPLWEDTDHSRTYINYIASHVPLTDKTALMNKLNISAEELDQSQTSMMNMANMGNHHNTKLDDFLIYRSLEIYLFWNSFINYLKVPLFRVEDLSTDKNVTVLDEIFRSVGRDPPRHEKVMDIFQAQENQRQQQHQQHQRQRQRRQLLTQQHTRKRIRKGSRIHRPTLTWKEVCRATPENALAFLEMSQSFGYYLDMDVASLCD